MKFTARAFVFAAALTVGVFSVNVSAQDKSDTISVHVRANVSAMVSIVPNTEAPGFYGDSGVVSVYPADAPAINVPLTLKLVSPGYNSSVRHGAARTTAAASAAYRRGAVQLNLNSENFENAQVSLYTVNGRRVMRGNLSRTDGIMRRNVATGVYIMNVAGSNGNNFSYRFTHGGGRLEIVPTFTGAGVDNRQTMRQAVLPEATTWTLTARNASLVGFPYRDTSFVIDPRDNDTITVTLRQLGEDDNGNGDEWVSALEFFRSRNNGNGTRLGWNLGNTLDAVCKPGDTAPACESVSDWTAVEGAWWTPAATQQLINGLAAQGVDVVRIGTSYVGHFTSGAPDYTISAARLNRVQQVVDMVVDAGMIAIINIHHDGNYTEPDRGTWGFLKFAEAMNNQTLNTQIVAQIERAWTQIANRFKDYGPELIFETFNELHSGNWGSPPENPNQRAQYEAEQDRLFQWNTTALNAIRATGGNNLSRYVAVPALGSTEPAYVIDAHNRQRLLPLDTLGGNRGTSRLMVSVHFYAPWRFTVAGVVATQGQNLIHDITTNELNHIATEAGRIKSTFIDRGIAVYYGEWGAPTRTRAQASAGGVTMTQTIRNAHVDYIERVARATVQNEIVPIIWDDGGNFQMIDRETGNPATSFWNNDENRQVQSDFLTRVWNAYKQAVGK